MIGVRLGPGFGLSQFVASHWDLPVFLFMIYTLKIEVHHLTKLYTLSTSVRNRFSRRISSRQGLLWKSDNSSKWFSCAKRRSRGCSSCEVQQVLRTERETADQCEVFPRLGCGENLLSE